MSYPLTSRLSFISVIAGLSLSGCAGFLEKQWPITVKTPPERDVISFEAPALKGGNVIRVSNAGAFEIDEYVRYDTADLRLEAVYTVSGGIQMVLQYPYTMRSMINEWNANTGHAKSWGGRGEVQAWPTRIDYQAYHLTDLNRQCAGFQSQWNYQPRDPQGRPTKALFGYVCARPGVTLSDQMIADILSSVRIDRRPGDLLPRLARASVVEPDAVAAITGKAQPGTGIAAFPLNLGVMYFESEDGDSIAG